MRTPLVRGGVDARIPGGGHTALNVHTEMIYQICTDFNGLPDVRTLTAGEIRFFYDGLRARLRKDTAPPKKAK